MGGNFKVRALKSAGGFFNDGDIIEFKDGYCRWIDGYESRRYLNFEEFIKNNIWMEDYLKLIEEEGVNKMEDLRELIKPCYVVVRRDGSVCGIFEVEEGLKLQEKLDMGNCVLEDYDEQLYKRGRGFSETDIMGIYGFSTNGCFNISTHHRPLIWKRTEKSPTQIKLEELEKKQREIADEMEKLRKEL